MAIKVGESQYQCFYCLKIFSHPEEADSCRESHNLVYIPASRKDLGKLLQFIVSPNPRLLEENRFVEIMFNLFNKSGNKGN